MSVFDWFRRDDETRDEPAPAKRLTDDLWVRLLDLPGYREWAADYDRLERIIPNLADYHLLVHPEHVKRPPDGYFERLFQAHLDDTYEQFGHLNLPRYNLQDYKRGGKLSNTNS